jgi:predicted permease
MVYHGLKFLLLRTVRRRQAERELDDEIRAHLAIDRQDRLDRGEVPQVAEQNARRTFGNELLIKENTRDMWGWITLERILGDLTYALRQLKRSPGFAAVAILSLTLGIGANSAIFSILNAMLFKSLPVPAPEQLFILTQQSQRAPTVPQRLSYPMFLRLRDAHSGATGVAAMTRVTSAQTALQTGPRSEPTPVQLVSGEFFSVLRLSPALGRLLNPGDNQTVGGNAVAVISHGFWQREFAGSSDTVGRSIRLNGAPFTIVGVAPEGFRGVVLESPTDVWIPLMMQSNVHYAQNFSSHDTSDPEKPWIPQEFIEWLDVIVRVNPASAPTLGQGLNAVFLRSLESMTSNFDAGTRRFLRERSLTLEPFAQGFSNARQRFTSPLVAMMAMVALVLLIACANTANLLMARAEGRRREIAVRLSIGASRRRLIQQLLTESFLLVAVAAGLGLLLAQWASEQLVRMALGVASGLPTPLLAGVDRHVLAFTIGLSIATGLLFGLAPAFRATNMELAAVTKGTRIGRSRFSSAKALVSVQVALSLIVIVGAALFARSLRNLAKVELGFDREHVLTVLINPRSVGYDAAQLPALYRHLVERTDAIPGVRSAVVSMCPLAVECRSSSGGVKISGYQAAPNEDVRIQFNYVGPEYFSTVGMHLVNGRDFNSRDKGSQFTIVNQATVRRYFADRSPIGQRIGDHLESEIIGVVQDARVNRVREEAVPMAYHPLEGNLVYAGTLEVRAAGDPNAIASDVRKMLNQVAPDLPIDRITPLALQVDRSLSTERMGSVVTSFFGVLALGLACFGLYGVISYAVTRRTSEIGIRMALGARPANVLWTVLREALTLIALGLAAGVPVVIFASHSIAALLYGIEPNDPFTLLTTIGILSSVAAFAALWPAWRASRVNPVAALRHE